MSEELIFAMSVKGSMGLDSFHELFSSSNFHGEHDEEVLNLGAKIQIARILESLGFCEFDYKKRKVYMCEPAFVLLPSTGAPKGVLVGARIPQLVEQIKKVVRRAKGHARFIKVYQTSYGLQIPPLICIEVDELSTLKNIAIECGIRADVDAPVAWKMANFSASIENIENGLSFTKRSIGDIEPKTFDIEKLMFIRGEGQAQFRLNEITNSVNKQKIHWFWNGDEAAVVDRDWGRYLVLYKLGKTILSYDSHHLRLLVPASVPLPTILSRSIAMCTGLAPSFSRTGKERHAGVPSNYPVHIYSGVPEDIYGVVRQKLGQSTQYEEIKTNNSGEIK